MTGRSLLNRDADGRFKFAHRSMMEFLVACRVLQSDRLCHCIAVTDTVLNFLLDRIGETYRESLRSIVRDELPGYRINVWTQDLHFSGSVLNKPTVASIICWMAILRSLPGSLRDCLLTRNKALELINALLSWVRQPQVEMNRASGGLVDPEGAGPYQLCINKLLSCPVASRSAAIEILLSTVHVPTHEDSDENSPIIQFDPLLVVTRVVALLCTSTEDATEIVPIPMVDLMSFSVDMLRDDQPWCLIPDAMKDRLLLVQRDHLNSMLANAPFVAW
jgi:hypothetical protein